MKKKDQKKLLIAILVLAAVILAGLGIWNYAAGDGNLLKFNQKKNIQVTPQSTIESFGSGDMNFSGGDMNFDSGDMN